MPSEGYYDPIRGFSGEWGFLSNFAVSPFRVDVDFLTDLTHIHSSGELPINETFQWNEQWFMFHKSTDPRYRFAIMNAKTPGECKRLGKQCQLQPTWEKIKDEVMLHGLRYKFTQNIDLAVELAQTNGRYLEETNTWGDHYWGVAHDGDRSWGRNRLGHLLMQVRSELTVLGSMEAYKV